MKGETIILDGKVQISIGLWEDGVPKVKDEDELDKYIKMMDKFYDRHSKTKSIENNFGKKYVIPDKEIDWIEVATESGNFRISEEEGEYYLETYLDSPHYRWDRIWQLFDWNPEDTLKDALESYDYLVEQQIHKLIDDVFDDYILIE